MIRSYHSTYAFILMMCGAVMPLTTGCGADDAEPAASPLEPGERHPGGQTTEDLLLGVNAFISPAENITIEHEQMFFSGNSFFNQAWVEAPASTKNRDGLGPLFNARSCSACHFKDGRGAPPESPDDPFLGILLRLSIPGQDEHGGPLADPIYGGQLQPFALPNVDSEADARVTYTMSEGTYTDGTPYTLSVPTYTITNPRYGDFASDLMVSPRVAPHVIGLGLLEAITEDRLTQLSDPDDADGDGISGRMNMVWDASEQALRPGRFGWKGDAPSVRQQVAGAFLGDMGITSPVFPGGECMPSQMSCIAYQSTEEFEIDPGNFERVVVYSKLLAVPVRRDALKDDVLRGKRLFTQAQCTACHTPSHTTGVDPDFPEVSTQLIWPYTDLLLHDMGEELADGRPVFAASGTEWKTPPLWGIGWFEKVNGHQRLMHDGRADGVAEAILWHGGEAETSRDAFKAMPQQDRDDLIAFVESL